ncbi:MAG: hypothetical protein NT079_02090 [Candidatus Omnitrophica bacterium]|nr:hypothetical protein [Candidatus Omnitrophota bacterium]
MKNKMIACVQGFMDKAINYMPRYYDAIVMSLFAIFITWQPYYLVGEINLFELGIYLPCINALLDGKIPYRDFFYLRGPLELYVPAFFMRFFGENISILSTIFYVGTIATLIIFVLIAKELYKTRFVFYLFVPVLIARTFPRVVFHIWGGMRFALGALGILFFIYFIKKRNFFWIFFAGVISSLAFLTSVEIGVCLVLTVVITLIFSLYSKLEDFYIFKKSFFIYSLGLMIVLVPHGAYLIATRSAIPFLDCVYSVATNMTKVFPDYLFESHPKNFIEALLAMNPLSLHFKHLTPAYCYLFFVGYIIFRFRKFGRSSFCREDIPVVIIAIYGLIMYVLAFRKIGAGQFEMALQPEKLLFFFMLERICLFLIRQKKNLKGSSAHQFQPRFRKKVFLQALGINFFILAFFMSSISYAVHRYNHRFLVFKYLRDRIIGKDAKELTPLEGQESKILTIQRARGMVVPFWQAEDFEQITEFVNKNTERQEAVFMFAEYGAYSFIVDRPFVGRFPMATFSWINDRWADELFEDLKKAKPRYAILPRQLDLTFEKVYFKVKQNKDNFDKVMSYINENYKIIKSTPSTYIYKRM